MTNAEYLAMQGRVELLSRLIIETTEADLDAFIAAGEHSDAFSPFLDPTAWMHGHDRLRMVIEHARAISKARRSIIDAAERAGVVVP